MNRRGLRFEQLLTPMSLGEFIRTHWQRETLHLPRADPAVYQSLLTLSDIESLLSTTPQRFPELQLVNAEGAPEVSDYCEDDGTVVPSRLLGLHREGATLVLSHAHRRIGSLAHLVRSTQASLQFRCQTNVYLSPASSQGFKPHHDAHDVFILQCHGQKRFRIYAGGPALPYFHERFRAGQYPVGDCQCEFILNPGDTLYIPRGVVHDAVSCGDSPSLHVTLGVIALTIRDVLLKLVDEESHHDPLLRKALDETTFGRRAAADPAAIDNLQSILDVHLQHVLRPESIELALSTLRDELALQARESLDRTLTSLPLADDSRIHVVADGWLNTEWAGETLLLRTFGQILEFDEPLASAVQQLLSRTNAQLSELQQLEPETRRTLVQRLIDAGVVVITPERA